MKGDVLETLQKRIDMSPMTPREFLQCRMDIGEALGSYCTQVDLSHILSRHKTNVSKMEGGALAIPKELGILLRLVRRVVIPSD